MDSLDGSTNPYIGLRPFFREDSLYFFGRRHQATELLERLHKFRFLAVVGSSGCGKSSLVRAGLVPALLGGFLVEQRDRWLIATAKPGSSPMRNLASALLRATDPDVPADRIDELAQHLHAQHTDAAADYLAPLLGSTTNLLLLVDQFEEIFSFRGAEDSEQVSKLPPAARRAQAEKRTEAANYVDLIVELSRRTDLSVYVVLTMRSDFLGDCDVFYGLPEAMNQSRYLVPRLTRPQLREAIVGPARLCGTNLSPRLLDVLLNDSGGRLDQLPILQHALLRTWEAWHKEGADGVIDLEHYTAAGTMNGALSMHAQEALRDEDLGVTAAIFKMLTDTDQSQRRVRRPANLSELAAVCESDTSVVNRIVDRFADGGRHFLVRSDGPTAHDDRIDISHESLIRQWDQLRSWVDEERKSRDRYLEILGYATKEAAGEKSLLRDPELTLITDWWQQFQPTATWAKRYSSSEDDFPLVGDYLERSRRAADIETQKRQRNKKRLRAAVVVTILAMAGLTTFALLQKEVARTQQRIAQINEQIAQTNAQEALSAKKQIEYIQASLTKVQDEASNYAKSVEESLAKYEAIIAESSDESNADTVAQARRSQSYARLTSNQQVGDRNGVVELVWQDRRATYKNIKVDGKESKPGQAVRVSPGQDVRITFDWQIAVGRTKDLYCPGCIVQYYYGVADSGSSNCFISGLMRSGWSKTGTVLGVVKAPKKRGVHYVTQAVTLEYACEEDKARTKFTDSPENAIAVFVVE